MFKQIELCACFCKQNNSDNKLSIIRYITKLTFTFMMALCFGGILLALIFPVSAKNHIAKNNAFPVVDLDALYIERTPQYGWDTDKNWPDIGEAVTFTLYLANKGTTTSGAFSVRWQTYDLNGLVIASSIVTQSVSSLSAGDEITLTYLAAFGDGLWRDGPYRVVATVDVTNTVDEGEFENNNNIDDYTDALSVAFMVEQDVYDWVSSQPTGRVEDVPEPSRSYANFYWFSQPSVTVPYREGTYSWEDWAQRQVKQMNEYFFKAENDYFESERNRLPRVRLDRVVIVPDGTIGFGNWPFGSDMTPDVGWGFKEVTPIYTDNNPEFMVVEWTLIHELGHHLGRHHPDLGTSWLNPVNQQLLTNMGTQAFAQRYNARYSGDISSTFGIMMNSGYERGYDPYSALGFDYQFQNKPGRTISERLGAQNAGNGRHKPVPTQQLHYWNSYYTNVEIWPNGLPDYSGNNYWIHFEQPQSPQLLVLGQNSLPLSGALVKVYRSDPVPDDKRMPTNYWNESIHWNGYLKIDTAGVYNFSVATISPVYITLTLNSQVIMENEYSYANNNEYLDQNHLITLPVGIIPLEFKIRTDFGGDIWKNFGLLYARPGDTLPRAIPATALFRDVSASLPGITGTYYSNATFTPPAVLVRVDSTLVFSDYVIDNTPEFTMTTNLFGMANPGQNASLLANPSNKLNQRAHMAVARVEYEGQEFFKVIDITNLNQSFWHNPISPEPILLNVNPDGTHSLLPFDGHAPELPYKVYIPIALKQ